MCPSNYRFVIAANGKIDNASPTFSRRLAMGTSRPVKTSRAFETENASGSSIAVSFHLSPMGGKPIREVNRGASTTIHSPSSSRAKLMQQSANAPLAAIGK